MKAFLKHLEIVVLAALVLLVLLPSRALAMAPQCDARGAITFAPPPVIQPLELSIDTGERYNDCDISLGLPEWRQDHPPHPNRLLSDSLGHGVSVVSLSTWIEEAPLHAVLEMIPTVYEALGPPGVRFLRLRPPKKS